RLNFHRACRRMPTSYAEKAYEKCMARVYAPSTVPTTRVSATTRAASRRVPGRRSGAGGHESRRNNLLDFVRPTGGGEPLTPLGGQRQGTAGTAARPGARFPLAGLCVNLGRP